MLCGGICMLKISILLLWWCVKCCLCVLLICMGWM